MRPPAADPTAWEIERIEQLGAGFLAAATVGNIGVAVLSYEAPSPRIVYISEKGAEIMGHSREEVLRRPARDFLTPTERALRQTDETRVPQSSGPHPFETVVRTADGRERPLEAALAPIDVDGLRGAIVIFREVGEEREASDALARSGQRFRRLIELAPDAVLIGDGRRIVFANAAAVRMLRYDNVEELLAASVQDLLAPEEEAPMRERTQAMLREGATLPTREYRTRRRDGSWFVAEVQSTRVEWEGAPAIMSVSRDVTGRKEMETRLAQSERLAALGTLLAGIAHEMNNPLSYAVLGIEQAIAQAERLSAPPQEIAKLREALDGALHGASRVGAIIGQIRASSRPDTNESGPVDVRAVLETALRVTRNELHHRARLVTELGAPAPVVVVGSANRLEQVFVNLLVNAVQALPDGRAENEIRVILKSTLAAPARQVVVEVSDNGSGIPEDVQPRIFDPFFTTKPVGLGLGLGLSICHGIVTNHGGAITVESAVGRGSTFRVVLPEAAPATRAATTAPSATAAAKATASPARRRRVLVIDDEPTLAAMIRRVLSRDCEVDLASDAREGLSRLESGAEYDVILCDLMMPDVTGMDLYADVAVRHPGLERRFIFMTGGAFTPRATDFLAQVPNRRLEKPFETAALRAIVAKDE
jgi:PAS domain S-box-containing protein